MIGGLGALRVKEGAEFRILAQAFVSLARRSYSKCG